MTSNLKKKIKDLGINPKKPKDFDPEDDPFSRGGEDSEEDDTSSDERPSGGREHYEAVGKSSLRKPKKLELDEKKYGGQIVSRSALNGDEDELDPFAPVNDDEDEDPFATKEGGASEDEEQDTDDDSLGEVDIDVEAEDDEIDSDDAFEEGEEEVFKNKGFVFRGSGKDTRQAVLSNGDRDMDSSNASEEDSMDGSEVNSDVQMEDLDNDENEADGDSEDDEDDENEQSAKPRPKSMMSSSKTDREKLKSLISSDAAAIATSLSQAASSDAKKGKAVRQQCQTFDRLLDARIKLQKGLTAANDLDVSPSSISDEEAQSALQKAEEAALRLYSTIESLRHSILESTTQSESKKRKRPSPATQSTTTSKLWSQISDLESQTLPTRLSTLDKWSTKTRSTTPISTSSKLDSSSTQTNLSTILSTYLLSQTPNLILQSTTPITTTTTTTASKPIPTSQPQPTQFTLQPYHDTNFYQSLLRDLITSRTTTSSTTAASSSSLPLKLHTPGNTKQKDTKASKGRKLRYTVHEKLANFMAATGRETGDRWSEDATREFFGSLMGGSGVLDEREDGDENEIGIGMGMDGLEGGEEREEEALRLFRS